jgi:ketosteroid isomerase-like protein
MAGRFLRTLLVILGLLQGRMALAGEPNRDTDIIDIMALREKVATAISRQDTRMLMECLARDFAFTAVNQVLVTNETQLEELFERMFRSDKSVLISLKADLKLDIPPRFLDANTGMCHGSSRDICFMRSGKEVEMDTRWSATLVKESGNWRVAMLHVGVDFLDNPVLDGLEKYASYFGIGAGIGGVLLGLSLGALVSRNKQSYFDRWFR